MKRHCKHKKREFMNYDVLKAGCTCGWYSWQEFWLEIAAREHWENCHVAAVQA